MEIASLLLYYSLVLLMPINGLILLAIRRERQHNRRILMTMWKMHTGGRR